MNRPLFSLKIFPFVGLAVLLSLGSADLAAAKEEPIQIAADKMTANENSQSVLFAGNVDAKQGTVRIRADEMTVFYEGGKPGQKEKKTEAAASKGSQQVREVFCKGKVEVTNEEWLGTANTMRYFAKKRLVQLIGNAKTYKGQNMVQGERIDYHLDSGKSEVFGAKTETAGKNGSAGKNGRVNMTILEE